MFDTWLPLGGGLILLIAGGDLLVRGAVRVAARLGVSPLVIGLTLVGFGTSAPELVTSVQAALVGAPGIAFGNIIGSNIANLLLILGIAALLCPIVVTSAALRRDGLVLVATAAVFAGLAGAVPLPRWLGAVFVLALAGYILWAFREERRAAPAAGHGAAYDKGAALQGADPATAPDRAGAGPILLPVLAALGGLGLVVLGGALLVDGAVALARAHGIAETVIGLTVVAVGTSLPELVTSAVAAWRRQGEIAFGNVVGSNVYNILGIGGATILVAPGPVPAALAGFDGPVMLGVSVLVIALAWTGRTLARWEGGGAPARLSGLCMADLALRASEHLAPSKKVASPGRSLESQGRVL